jgi:signal transduction histidine kinase/DNA-binding response OmpR family regulator
MVRARIIGILSLGLLVAVLVAANFYVHGPLRQQIIDRETAQIRYFVGNHAKLLESLLRTTELTLETALLRIERDALRGEDVHLVLRRGTEAWPMARVIGITDASGQVVHSSRSATPPDVNLADRDYVRHWLDGGGGAQFLSGPVRNAVDGGWQISLSRPIRRGGRLDGVISAVIGVDSLTPILKVSEATDDYATITDRRFRLVSRYPDRPEDIGRSLADAPLFQQFRDPAVNRADGMFGNYFTGEERIAAAVRFYDDHLILSSSRSLAVVLDYWRTLAVIIALVSLMLAAAATAFVAFALRQIAVEHHEAQVLGSLNHRLEERTREAERLAAAKSDFLAVMSHEIRTPLTAVMGMIDLAAQSADPTAIVRHLAVARRASRTLLAIINDILDAARLEAGGIVLEAIPTDVAELAAQAAATVRIQADDKGITLTVVVDDGVPPWLLGDPSRLTQILFNLLGNAVKFTERGSVVLRVSPVAGSAERRGVRFEVTDTGPGIPEGQHELLFRPFEQLAPSRARNYGGSGLGLSICKGLVEAMGGRIGVDSAPGRGSRFWFEVELPVAEEPPEAGLEEMASAATSLRIMVVDDNVVNRDLISGMLALRGHRVITVGSGRECLALAQNGDVDVVLLDIQMPDMDGIDTIRELHRLGVTDTVPVIALTANVLPEHVERYRAEGFQGHIGKPIDWRELFDRLAECAVGGALATGAPAAAEADAASAALDIDRIEALVEALGMARARAMTADALRQVRRTVAELEQGQPREAVARSLHTVCGLSGNFGLTAIYVAAGIEPVEGDTAGGPSGRENAVPLRRAAEDVELALDRLWGPDWREPADIAP